MMKVRTLKKHFNEYGEGYTKNVGRKYELPDRDAQRLIDGGVVEEDKPARAAEKSKPKTERKRAPTPVAKEAAPPQGASEGID